jgi:hypothetical protein
VEVFHLARFARAFSFLRRGSRRHVRREKQKANPTTSSPFYLQAASCKLQAASCKLQAASCKQAVSA